MSAINCPLYAYPVFDGRISISTDYYYATWPITLWLISLFARDATKSESVQRIYLLHLNFEILWIFQIRDWPDPIFKN